MDTNIYSNYDKLTENIGETLVQWIRKVLEKKLDKTNGSAKNEQSGTHSDLVYLKLKSKERLERKPQTIKFSS